MCERRQEAPSDTLLSNATDAIARLDGRKALSAEQLSGCLHSLSAVAPGSSVSAIVHLLGILQHSVARAAGQLAPAELLSIAHIYVATTAAADVGNALSKPLKAIRRELAARADKLNLSQACQAIRIFDQAPGGLSEQLEAALDARLADDGHDLSLPSIAAALESLAAARHVPPPRLVRRIEDAVASLAVEQPGAKSAPHPLHVVTAARGVAVLLDEDAAPPVLHFLASMWLGQRQPTRFAPPYEVATLAWALAVGGTLTPSLLRSLVQRLRYDGSTGESESDGRDTSQSAHADTREKRDVDVARVRRSARLTDAQARKLFQAEMAICTHGSRDGAASILPGKLARRARSAWLDLVKAGAAPSSLAKMVRNELAAMGVTSTETEVLTTDGLLSMDVLLLNTTGVAMIPKCRMRGRVRYGHLMR